MKDIEFKATFDPEIFLTSLELFSFTDLMHQCSLRFQCRADNSGAQRGLLLL